MSLCVTSQIASLRLTYFVFQALTLTCSWVMPRTHSLVIMWCWITHFMCWVFISRDHWQHRTPERIAGCLCYGMGDRQPQLLWPETMVWLNGYHVHTIVKSKNCQTKQLKLGPPKAYENSVQGEGASSTTVRRHVQVKRNTSQWFFWHKDNEQNGIFPFLWNQEETWTLNAFRFGQIKISLESTLPSVCICYFFFKKKNIVKMLIVPAIQIITESMHNFFLGIC